MNLVEDSSIRNLLNIKGNDGKWIIKFIKQFLRIDKLNNIYNQNKNKTGLEFVDSCLNQLGVKYDLNPDFESMIPKTGGFIVICNHPLGGIDGLLLLKILCKVRPDFKLQGNFLLQQIEPIKEFILPVNPFDTMVSDKSSHRGIKGALNHINNGFALGIFPAGEVSSYHIKDFKITDRKWQKSSLRFIEKSNVPVIPFYIHGYNSMLFYILGQIHPLLRTAKLPSELFNKNKKIIKLKIGEPISPKTIQSFATLRSLSHFLRAKTYALNMDLDIDKFFKKKSKKIKPANQIIDPVGINLIEHDLKNIEEKFILFSQSTFKVFCAPFHVMPNIMQEVGRLREKTFRDVGEGTNKSIDLDKYDLHFNHLIIWDENHRRIVGAYRLGRGNDIINQYGKKGFYISSLFKINDKFLPMLKRTLEMGRSFVSKEYQRHPMSLFLLWKGILWYLLKNPEYKYLVGPVSISNDFSNESKSLIVQFIKENHYDNQLAQYIKPRRKYKISKKLLKNNEIVLEGIDGNIKTLDMYINQFQQNLTIPVLLKKYLQLNSKIIGFNIDPDFNDCLDGLLVLDTTNIPYEILDSLSKELDEKVVTDRFNSK